MKFFLICGSILGAALAVGSATAGQHQGHAAPGQPSAAAEPSAACLEGGRQALGIVVLADARLDGARQSNRPADMRAAMDDLQAALGEIRSRLAACGAGPSAPANPHAGHQPGAPAPAAQAPVDHSKMGHAQQPPAPAASPAVDHSKMDHSKMGHAAPAAAPGSVESTDPVCGMKVTADRLKAELNGKTYLFCSEVDRQKFVADPAKYLKPAAPPK